MGLRGEKIEDKALAAGGEPIRKAISEIAPRSDSPKKQQKANRGEQDNIWLIIYGLQKQNGGRHKTIKIGIDKADRSLFLWKVLRMGNF